MKKFLKKQKIKPVKPLAIEYSVHQNASLHLLNRKSPSAVATFRIRYFDLTKDLYLYVDNLEVAARLKHKANSSSVNVKLSRSTFLTHRISIFWGNQFDSKFDVIGAWDINCHDKRSRSSDNDQFLDINAYTVTQSMARRLLNLTPTVGIFLIDRLEGFPWEEIIHDTCYSYLGKGFRLVKKR